MTDAIALLRYYNESLVPAMRYLDLRLQRSRRSSPLPTNMSGAGESRRHTPIKPLEYPSPKLDTWHHFEENHPNRFEKSIVHIQFIRKLSNFDNLVLYTLVRNPNVNLTANFS